MKAPGTDLTDQDFFPIHRSYFCVRRTDGAARIYFSSLYLSWNVSPYGQGLFMRMLEREREVRRKKNKKKAQEKSQEKPLHGVQDLKPRTLPPAPCLLFKGNSMSPAELRLLKK